MAAFKTCLLGESGVGKTTISRLLQHKNTNVPRKPTIGVDIEKVSTPTGNICMWDLAGQRRFQFMWEEFTRGTNLAIVVTDSSPENVKLTKELMDRHLKNKAAKVIAIANKQDLSNRLRPEQIQQELGVPTYGLVGIDQKNHEKLSAIIQGNL